MQLRQILTGSCNINNHCLSFGTLDSYTFISYGSGSDLVILNQDFVRQQIIPGYLNNSSQIKSISCAHISGKILVLYDTNVCVYEPQNKRSEINGFGLQNYIWSHHSFITTKAEDTRDLCWIPISSESVILVGKYLQVWTCTVLASQLHVSNENSIDMKWTCIWNKMNPGNTDVDMIKFSSDGKFFATTSLNSKNILIWFWDRYSSSYIDSKIHNIGSNELFDFIIIKHPSVIVNFEWRGLSSYLPKNSVNNSIMTCSKDNVCRIWTESHLNQYKQSSNPNDTLIINNNAKIPDHTKAVFSNYAKRKEMDQSRQTLFLVDNNQANFKNDPNFVYTYPEFILSASINDTTDIPLFTTLKSGKTNEFKLPFIVHWLNNKEYNFNQQIQKSLDLYATNSSDSNFENLDGDTMDKLSKFNRYLLLAINKWKKSSDVLFSIHPQNGSLLVWFIHNLDESGGHLCDNKSLIDKSIHIKNSQLTVHSCLPNCIPVADAMSMNSNILLYNEEKKFSRFSDDYLETNDDYLVNYEIKMISQQKNGSLNMWSLNVSNEDNSSSSFLNIKHLSRISGHRWQTNSAACHIHLPFLLTISNFNKFNKKCESELSELILWRIKPIGMFSKSGGLTEIARINFTNKSNLTKVAWFPGTIPTHLFGIDMSSPASFFTATDSFHNLSLYISIADAKMIVEKNIYETKTDSSSSQDSVNNFEIISLTSTGEPGCILSIGFIDEVMEPNNFDDRQNTDILMLHVFPKDMIITNFNFKSGSTNFQENKFQIESQLKYFETYFIVRLVNKKSESSEKYQSTLEMWQIQITDFMKTLKSKTINDLIHLKVTKEKVYCNILQLPDNVNILKAVPAASHLSSASIYPSCLAPYLITTLCSDGSIRFWECVTSLIDSNYKYEWIEWSMQLQKQCLSTIFLNKDNVPLEISCAYSGRVAVAYCDSFNKEVENTKLTINVDIYECESTGGSEWILENCIKLPNFSLSKSINNNENFCEKQFEILKNKIQIDWVNSEDGTHLLSVALGPKIMIYTPTCLETCKYSRFTSETSSLSNFTHWTKVDEVILKTADSLPPIPVHISWAREGLLIVGLDNEVHVYNQWNFDSNNFGDDNLKKVSNKNYSLARLNDSYHFHKMIKKSASKNNFNNNYIDSNSCDEILQCSGLFEAVQIHNPVLPQYHPKLLMEWINFCKIKRVKAILSHLTNCISMENSKSNENFDNESFKTETDENIFEMRQLEIKAIPPLPLYVLLEIDTEIEKPPKKININKFDHQNSVDLSYTNQEYLSKSPTQERKFAFQNISRMFSNNYTDLLNFGPEQARRLSNSLSRLQLPGLSALDQIYLLGIAELMCNLKCDIRSQMNSNSTKIIDSENILNEDIEIHNFGDQQISTNSIDDCGLRFLLAMQHFSYMSRTLPLNQRNNLMIQGMDTSCIIWGFHSESEDELCLRLDELTSHNITWIDFKRYGCGWWIRNSNILQRIIEKIAKNTFQKSKNPMDSAIFYLVLGKQKLVAKLFKNCNQSALFTFFNLDFSLDENKNRALNQAYKMRSKRRYDHAVALFLLCHSIDDAILICLHNLKDMQLAITISRLYDLNLNRNSKHLVSIIQSHIITNCDPFIRSMGYWILEDYVKSLDSLLEYSNVLSYEAECSKSLPSLVNSTDTIVFVFYNFLKSHPIILRQKLILSKKNGFQTKAWNKESCITPIERRLYFRTAYTYLKMGCPDLALEVLSKLPENTFQNNEKSEKTEQIEIPKTDIFDLTLTDNFDVPQTDNISFQIQWSDEVENNLDQNNLCSSETNPSGKLDIMCLQYKFMICLKLITEELCTLATGIECHGSYLRFHLYSWLEKEVQVLQTMCGYSNISSEKIMAADYGNSTFAGMLLFNNKEYFKFSLKDKIILRKQWLKTNQSLILSLYSFCTLHRSNIVGLAAIRMELLILLQELQGSNHVDDSCRFLHPSINIPFINSSFAPENGLIITPVQQLKTYILEIVDCLNNFQFLFLYCHPKHSINDPSKETSRTRNQIELLRNQCQALSACLHQCLSNFSGIHDNEEYGNFQRKSRSRQNSTSVIYTAESDIHLRSKCLSESNIVENMPNSDPMKWPGYSNLFKAIGCKPKTGMTNFCPLLAESLLVVYVGILIYALELNDINLLFRIAAVEFNKNFWTKVFGGTLRLKPERPAEPPGSPNIKDSSRLSKDSTNQLCAKATNNIPRDRLYYRLSPPINSKCIIEETFIPPLYPILTCLLEKPSVNQKSEDFIYDSDSEEIDENMNYELNDNSDSECTNSNSYTWCLIRLIMLHNAHFQIKNLLKIIQLEYGELALFGSNIFSIINSLVRWQNLCKNYLNDFVTFPKSYFEFFHDCDQILEKSTKQDHVSNRLNIICKNLSNVNNTPFKSGNSISQSMKRLWVSLINKPDLQPIFIQQFIHFKTNDKLNPNHLKQDSSTNSHVEATLISNTGLKIIHKDHECLNSLAINRIDNSLLVVSTSKEIIELSMNNLMSPEKWSQDDYEYLQNVIRSDKNSKTFNRISEKCLINDFLLLSPTFGSQMNHTSQINNVYPDSSNVILKRQINGVQIIKSHPSLPYYLTGNSNGQVGVFEWNVDTPIVKTYSPIQKGKITALNFDISGNKFGMGDSEGNFSLFHFSYADNSRAQYFQTRCPHKGVLDFCFLNSSSIVATCGGSTLYGISTVNHLHAVGSGVSTFDNNSVNVSIWDVLLPAGRNQVRNLSDLQLASGVTTLCYASRYELLLAGTRKGEIAFIDIRQNAIQNLFQAHDSCITSFILDPLQHYVISSAMDGYIKIWCLFNQELMQTFRSDPVKTSVFSKGDVAIKSISLIDDNKLISCSTDGYIKLRFIEPKLLYNNINNDIVIL